MCFLVLLLLFSSRAIAVLWWIIDTDRWASAFNSVAWPILGILLMPWTTIMWVAVAPNGTLAGYDWVWLALGVLFDVSSYGSGGLRRR